LQSPENGSRLCKWTRLTPSGLPSWRRSRNPLRTGLGSARRLPCADGGRSACPSRNPLRTGLGSASVWLGWRWDGRTFVSSQSPENGSLLCKPGLYDVEIAFNTAGSQSPENGSLLCKAGSARIRIASPFCLSQSPEDGSRLCKERAEKLKRPGVARSQSPENGSRLCKVN